jgi:hypothetical protein
VLATESESSLAEDLDRVLPTNRRREDRFSSWREELKGYAADLKNLRHQPYGDALGWLSSVSARALEMQMFTLDYDDRAATRFRIDAILPFKEEIQMQFSITSRRQAVAEMELKMAGGQWA